jgi:hypothetical protein
MFQKLGNAYYFNGKLEKAQWYGELFAMTLRSNQLIIIRYAISAFHRRNDKADQIMEKFDQISGMTVGRTFAKRNYMDAIKANSGRYKVENAGINSPIQIMELCIPIRWCLPQQEILEV